MRAKPNSNETLKRQVTVSEFTAKMMKCLEDIRNAEKNVGDEVLSWVSDKHPAPESEKDELMIIDEFDATYEDIRTAFWNLQCGLKDIILKSIGFNIDKHDEGNMTINRI